MAKMKKAQAAMEFLMTYGWAILVVLAAIAALAYFGVLNHDEFMPEKCITAPGIACLDFNVNQNQTELILANSLGKDIQIDSITINNCSTSYNQTFNNGDRSSFIVSICDNGEPGTKFKGDITIEYSILSLGFSKIHSGEINSKVQ